MRLSLGSVDLFGHVNVFGFHVEEHGDGCTFVHTASPECMAALLKGTHHGLGEDDGRLQKVDVV